MVSSERVRAHYDGPGLMERVRQALAALGPDDARLAPEQVAGLDQFHTRGLAATLELGRDAGLRAGERVLDIGCGLGGPARVLAARHGVSVAGIDLSPAFIEAGREITRRCGMEKQVTLALGDATRADFAEGGFDAVFLLHVAMNIAAREALYRGARRALAPGGRFVSYDIVRVGGEPYFPVPWARTEETSFLLTAEATRASVEAAGFRVGVWRDDSAVAKAFFEALAAGAAPAGPSLAALVGADFRTVMANLARSFQEGRIGVLAAVFEAV